MRKKTGLAYKTKGAQKDAKYRSQSSQIEKQQRKKNELQDKKFKAAAKKFQEEISKALRVKVEEIPYADRVSRIDKYISRKKNEKLFTLNDFVAERFNIILDWCYICHRTLFSVQAAILKKDQIKPELPKEHLADMPEKMITCHRCKKVLMKEKHIPAQSFWNNLDPGSIPKELADLTSMEKRMIQRMIPFMKIVKYKGLFGQFGLHGQAVLFARDVCEILDVLPRKQSEMELIMVVESLQNIERQNEMIINQNRVQRALDWLLKNNDRYNDVQVDTNALQIDYSQFCVIAPPVVRQKKCDWKTLDLPGAGLSNVVKALNCKQHELSESFIKQKGSQSLSMCTSSLVKCYIKAISLWDSMDLDSVLEEGHSLFIASKEDISDEAVTFDTIKTCFTMYERPIEVAFVNREIFKRDHLYEFVENYLTEYGRAIIYTNKVYIAIVKENEEYFLFDSRPRGAKGYACIKNKKNEYNGGAIVMQFNNFHQFLKRLESQLKGTNATEYTLASVIVSEPENQVLVSTFGDSTPSLHTNPIFKDNKKFSPFAKETENDEPDINFSDQLSVNIAKTVLASHCQSDARYGEYLGKQCTGMACGAIITSLMIPLNNWTTRTMDEVLEMGNAIYIETCIKLGLIRDIPAVKVGYIAATEIVEETYQFNQNIVLKIEWKVWSIIRNLEQEIVKHFEEKPNGIFTCEDYTYGIMYENNKYWFFDSHSNQPYGTAALHCVDLGGLVQILKSKVREGQSSRFDISSVEVTFSESQSIECRMDYIPDGKHFLSDASRDNEILKKAKVEANSSVYDDRNSPFKTPIKQLESMMEEMSPYLPIYDTRQVTDDECRFHITPWKDNEVICSENEHYKRRLNLYDQLEIEADPIIPAEEISKEQSLCYVTTAINCEKNRELCQIFGHDILVCIVATLNLNIDSVTGWSPKRLQSVLDEAEKLLPSFNYRDDELVAFGEKFNIDKFSYGKTTTPEIKDFLLCFFQAHDYGLLRYDDKEYLISYLNDYYYFLDPHPCNSNGYPSKNGTSCVIVTKSFDALIDNILDRLTCDDNSLRTTIENKKPFYLLAIQVEQINDICIVQKDLNYEYLQYPKSIRSLQNHQFVQETEHLCTAVAAVTTNFINSFEIWDPNFMNSIQKDGAKIYQDQNRDKQINITNDFKMFSLSGQNIQTSVYEVVIDDNISLSDILSTYFESYDSGIMSLNNEYYSIMCKNGQYCLFDSHGMDHQGNSGATCAIMVNSISQLEDLILTRGVQSPGNEDLKITFYRLDITKIGNVDFEFRTDDFNSPKTPDVKLDTTVFDAQIDCPVSLMRPIDQIIPKADELFDVIIDNKDLNSENIPLIAIKRATKPPLNHKIENRFEEFCFPTLFPYGINGLKQQRDIKMSPLQYFQSRIMGKDPRFHTNEYLLFALNFVENEKVAGNISVCGKIKQNNQDISNVASNLHLVMRTIRGTSAYWSNQLLDLLAMVKVLGPGTAFLTLSCNDLNWEFMLKTCLQAEGRGDLDPSKLTLPERQRLVENNPVMVSRLFNREVQNMLKLLKNGQALSTEEDTWKVTDYWYRIEWQQRGSPHCHMIIWIKDFPKLNTPEGIKAMDSICHCNIPKDDEELAALVKRYQRHRCTDTCVKTRNPSKETKDNEGKTVKRCRFAFPRKPCKETRVLDPESSEFITNGHRLVQMKRDEDARYINNYNPNILRVWQANMDFQFITSKAIIAYVAKYSCKSETNTLHKLINEAIKEAQAKNEETRKTLFKITMKILNERQVSCCEAATRLCRLCMQKSTREVVFINSSRPEERYRMLKVETADPTNNTYYNNIIDRYQLRPDELEHLSLAEFAMEYKPDYIKKSKDIVDEESGDPEFNEENEDEPEKPSKAIKLKDGKSYIRKRQRSAVFRSRYFSSSDNRANYFYGLLLLHVPFRSETELLQKPRQNDDAPIERYAVDETDIAFAAKKHLLRPLNDSCTLEEYIQCTEELEIAIRQMEVLLNGANNEEDNSDETNETVQDVIADVNVQVDMPNLPHASSLNSDQRKLYDLVQEWIQCYHKTEKANQLMIFTTGSAGTGKSFVIAQIVKIVTDYFAPKYPNSRAIFVTAPTGIAAKQVNGFTLHSALALGIELGQVSKHKPLTGQYLKQKREIWKNVKFLIIDEISMVSYELFKNIDLRLKELMMNDLPFGGINVLLFGDLMQLPPVQGHCIYDQPYYLAEVHLWSLFDFCELKQNMRQKNDQPFIELLNALRVGTLDNKQRLMLQQRVEGEHLKREGMFDDMCSTLITPVTVKVREHNAECLQKLIAQNLTKDKEKYQRNSKYQGFYLIRAIDELQDKKKDRDWEKFIPKDDNKCGGIPKELQLAVGARVMLRRNIDVARGLVNGALGVVKSFDWGSVYLKDQSEPGDLPGSVTVTFDGIGDVIIKPQRLEFNATGGHGKVDRVQLPLILAWAITAHKLQGVTVESVVLDISKSIFAKGQGYVMLSRARKLENILILRPLEMSKISKQYVNDKALTEMNRLRALKQEQSIFLLQPRGLTDPRVKLN